MTDLEMLEAKARIANAVVYCLPVIVLTVDIAKTWDNTVTIFNEHDNTIVYDYYSDTWPKR